MTTLSLAILLLLKEQGSRRAKVNESTGQGQQGGRIRQEEAEGQAPLQGRRRGRRFKGRRQQQERQGDHGQGRLALALPAHFYGVGGAPRGHPLTQRRDGNLSSHNETTGNSHERSVSGTQQDQYGTNHELVGDGVEKGAKGRATLPAAGQKAVEPVRERGGAKEGDRSQVRRRKVEKVHKQGNCQAARIRQQIGKADPG
jgi:hypothetical protein